MSSSSSRTAAKRTYSSSAATTPGTPTIAGPTITRSTPTRATPGRRRRRQLRPALRQVRADLRAPFIDWLGRVSAVGVSARLLAGEHGYDVTYCSNIDMLDPARSFSAARSSSASATTNTGTSVSTTAAMGPSRPGVTHLYLSGNSVLRAHAVPASRRRPCRTASSAARASTAGAYGELDEFYKYPFPQEGPKANLLMGAHTVYPFNGGGDWICTKPDHWIFTAPG